MIIDNLSKTLCLLHGINSHKVIFNVLSISDIFNVEFTDDECKDNYLLIVDFIQK